MIGFYIAPTFCPNCKKYRKKLTFCNNIFWRNILFLGCFSFLWIKFYGCSMSKKAHFGENISNFLKLRGKFPEILKASESPNVFSHLTSILPDGKWSRKVCARRIPHNLTEARKHQCVVKCCKSSTEVNQMLYLMITVTVHKLNDSLPTEYFLWNLCSCLQT